MIVTPTRVIAGLPGDQARELDAFLLSTPNDKLGKKARALKRRIQKALAGKAA